MFVDREADLERMAEEIADESVAGYDKILPPHVVAEMRRLLIFDMLCTDEGRASLRLCLEDPVVAKSEDVATGPEAVAAAKDKVGGGER